MAVPPLIILLLLATNAAIVGVANATSIHPGDLVVLEELHRFLTNPDSLGWPKGTDLCSDPAWAHVSYDCSGRVNNLDHKNAGLVDALRSTFAKLDALQDLKLQNNTLSCPLPSFWDMAPLRHTYLNGNAFDTFPSDFFDNLEEICLDENPLLNASAGGWAILPGIATSAPQLRSLRFSNCNLVGTLPESLGTMTGLQQLRLSYNPLTGPISTSFGGSGI